MIFPDMHNVESKMGEREARGQNVFHMFQT